MMTVPDHGARGAGDAQTKTINGGGRRPRSRLSRGAIIKAFLAVIVGGSAVVLSLLRPGAMSAILIPPTSIATALHRVGLGPEELVAAGVSEAVVREVVRDAAEYYEENWLAITQADAARASTKVEADRLRRLVRGGGASDEDVTACTTAMAAESSAAAACTSTYQALFAAATAGLTLTQKARVQNLRDSAKWSAISPGYRIVSRTDARWIALRDALAHVRIVTGRGETPDAGPVALVDTAQSDPEVSLALARLSTSLAGMTAAWENEVGLAASP